MSKGYQSISNAITGKETPATQFENPYTAIKNEVQGNTQANLEPTSVGKDISKIGAGASTAAFNLVKAPLSVGIQTASELPGAQYLMQAIGKGIDI